MFLAHHGSRSIVQQYLHHLQASRSEKKKIDDPQHTSRTPSPFNLTLWPTTMAHRSTPERRGAICSSLAHLLPPCGAPHPHTHTQRVTHMYIHPLPGTIWTPASTSTLQCIVLRQPGSEDGQWFPHTRKGSV